MRFEQILKVYWSKGLYYGGVLTSVDTNVDNLIKTYSGIGRPFKSILINRFESILLKYDRTLPLTHFTPSVHLTINKFFSKMAPFKHTIFELTRMNIIRLYLIKSYRGRAQAIGKPSRGQRTWSNAWTAYRNNTVIRSFMMLVRRLHADKRKPVKIDYKREQKKYGKPKFVRMFKKEKPKLNNWF